MRKAQVFFGTLLFFVSNYNFAQSPIYSEKKDTPKQLKKIADYSTRDGLYSNAVTGIFKDANGFFWIQSYNTLQRWNGKQFFGESIFISPDSLKKIAPKKKFIYNESDVEQNYFLIDNDSKLYASKGLELATQTYPNTLQTGFELNAFRDFFKTHGNDSAFNFLNKKNYCAYKTKDGFIVVDFDLGLYYVSRVTGVVFVGKYTFKDNDFCYMLLGDKLMYYQRETGIYKILQNDSFLYEGKLPVEVPAEKKYIGFNQILSDTKHITFANGVLRKFELQADNSVNATDLLVLKDYEKYSCFYFDEINSTLYIGTLTSGFSSYQLSNKNFRNISSTAKENYVYTHQIINNTLMSNIDFYLQYQKKDNPNWSWLLTSAFCPINQSDYLYGYGNKICIARDNKLVQQKVENSPYVLHHFVTTDSVIYLLRETINQYYPATNNYTAGNLKEWPSFGKPIYTIAKAAQPNLLYALIGTELQALNMHTHSSTTLASGITGETRSIDIDTTNNGLFISTKYSGCYYYKKNILTKLPLAYNSKQFNNHYVLQDKEGDYWLPTNEGLFFMFKKDFTNFLNGKSRAISFKKFGKEDGIINEEFNGGFNNAGILFRDSIYMGTMAGTLVFHPSIKYIQKRREGKLILDYIKFDTTTIETTDNFELPPNFKQLNIKASYPFIYDNGNLQYRILGSNDTAWYNLNTTGLLEIKNIVAGNYKIEIKPTTNNSIIKISFTVRHYWYNTWWMYSIYVLLVGILLYILFSWRLLKIKNKQLALLEQSKSQLFTTIAHDLRSPINNFTTLSETMQFLISEKDFDTIAAIGADMDKKSKNLTLLLSNILDWSLEEQGLQANTTATINIQLLLATILPPYKDMAAREQVTIINQVVQQVLVQTNEQSLSTIIRNLTDNAIKNAVPNSLLNIYAQQNANSIYLQVSNTASDTAIQKLKTIQNMLAHAKPIVPLAEGVGLGLALVHSNVVKLGGSIKISISHQTVTFYVELPSMG